MTLLIAAEAGLRDVIPLSQYVILYRGYIYNANLSQKEK